VAVAIALRQLTTWWSRACADQDVDWETIRQATKENAPHGFIIYWSTDFGSLMRLSGDRLPAVQYLMGNHVIAQRMFHYDRGRRETHGDTPRFCPAAVVVWTG
jgi:hypothetical protein